VFDEVGRAGVGRAGVGHEVLVHLDRRVERVVLVLVLGALGADLTAVRCAHVLDALQTGRVGDEPQPDGELVGVLRHDLGAG